jgi:hypothetical protein
MCSHSSFFKLTGLADSRLDLSPLLRGKLCPMHVSALLILGTGCFDLNQPSTLNIKLSGQMILLINS